MIKKLKQIFEDKNFIVNEIIDDVIVVNNFLSKEELSQLFDIINSTPEEDWLIEYTTNLKRFCMEKFKRDDVENLVKEGKFEITKGWQDKNLSLIKYPISDKINQRLQKILLTAKPDIQFASAKTLQRMQEGVELKAHTDQHTDPAIEFATIIYLNDEYSKGELFFVNKDLELKPEAGSLVVFPGTDEFEHGVRVVGPGPIRYVIVGFVKTKDFYKNNNY
jgi:hypothetical protein